MSEYIVYIGKIASSIGAVIALVSPIVVSVLRFLKKLHNRLNSLEGQLKEERKLAEQSVEERKMMLSGIYACLDGLHQMGCNGRVTRARENLNSFLIEASLKGETNERLN